MKTIHSTCVINGKLELKEKIERTKNVDVEILKENIIKNLRKENKE